MKYQNAKADLPGQLPVVNRKAAIITLLLLLFALLAFVGGQARRVDVIIHQEIIEIDDIPITRQQIQEPERPPVRAEVIEAEEDEEVDTVIIAETDLVVDSFVPIVVDDDEIYDFFAVEEQATIAHKQEPRYPDLARRSGMEGIVMVEVVISAEGDVVSAEVVGVRPKGVEGFFEEAALAAARQFKFTPAKQRGRAVSVRQRIPFEFRLN